MGVSGSLRSCRDRLRRHLVQGHDGIAKTPAESAAMGRVNLRRSGLVSWAPPLDDPTRLPRSGTRSAAMIPALFQGQCAEPGEQAMTPEVGAAVWRDDQTPSRAVPLPGNVDARITLPKGPERED